MVSDVEQSGIACEVTDRCSILWPGFWMSPCNRCASHCTMIDSPSGATITHRIHEATPGRQKLSAWRLSNPISLSRATVNYHFGEPTVTLPHARGDLRLP